MGFSSFPCNSLPFLGGCNLVLFSLSRRCAESHPARVETLASRIGPLRRSRNEYLRRCADNVPEDEFPREEALPPPLEVRLYPQDSLHRQFFRFQLTNVVPKPPRGGEMSHFQPRASLRSPCKYFYELHESCSREIFAIFICCIIVGSLHHPLGDSLTSNFHLSCSAAAASGFPLSHISAAQLKVLKNITVSR